MVAGLPEQNVADNVTEILKRAQNGDDSSANEFCARMIDTLRDIAGAALRREQPGHTLRATELADEALMRMLGANGVDFASRAHFLALASREIRRMLIDHAERKRALKRGGDGLRFEIDQRDAVADGLNFDMLALNEALDRLATFEPDGARIVEMRFFGGMTMPEIAEALNKPLRNVERDWAAARAQLKASLR